MTIGALNSISIDQYWKVQNTAGGRSLECIDKPSFICTISQAWDFAEVMEVALQALKAEGLDAVEIEGARTKLIGRYNRLVGKQSFPGKLITSFFLWIMGFRGEDSLESMADSVEVIADRLITRFVGGSEISDEAFKTAIERHPHLEILTIRSCKQISDEGLIAAVEKYPDLKVIDLCGCTQLTGASLEAIQKSCRQLEEIDLTFCQDNLNFRALMSFLKAYPDGITINVTGFTKVSDDMIRQINPYVTIKRFA